MSEFSNCHSSIARQIMWRMMMAMLVVVSVVCLWLSYWDYRLFKRQVVAQSDDVVSLLHDVFVDVLLNASDETAARTLSVLNSRQKIADVYLYAISTDMIFRFNRTHLPAMPPQALEPSSHFDGRYIHQVSPIHHQGAAIGTVYLRMAVTSESWVRAHLLGYLWMSPFLLLAVFVSVYTLQRDFSKPLDQLTDLILRIGKQQDLSLRVTTPSNQAISVLFDGFNHLLESLERSKKISQNIRFALDQSAIVSITDRYGNIIFVNDQFCALSGFSMAELVGANHRILSSGTTNKAFYKQMWKILTHGEVFQGEIMNKHKSGDYYWLRTTIVPFLDKAGNPTQYISVAFDISAQKEAKTHLRKVKDDLEERVIERTKALKASQDCLIQSEKMAALGSLVAGVAHEINTPVGIGVTAASHLEEEMAELKEAFESNTITRRLLIDYLDSGRSTCKVLLSNMTRAADLVKSFKDVAADQSCGDKREFDLGEYLREVLLSLHPKIKKTKHKVDLSCPKSVIVNSYPGSISQIITNLVTNSLVHGFDNLDAGEIEITVMQERNNVHLSYRDNGKGIPKEQIVKMYEPFYTTRRGLGSTGLGMHIVSGLVLNTLKGTINCESNAGKGVHFLIEFPKDPEKPLSYVFPSHQKVFREKSSD